MTLLLTDHEYRQQALAEAITYATKKIKACHSASRGLQRRGAEGIDWAMQCVSAAKRAAADIESSLDWDADALTEELMESAASTAAAARATSAELRREVRDTMDRIDEAKALAK